MHPLSEQRPPTAVVLTLSSDHLPAVLGASRLERAGIPVLNRPAAVLTAADKVRTAISLATAGIPVPQMISIVDAETALAHATRIGYPLVLKAADGVEGNPVRYVGHAQELSAAIYDLRASMGQPVTHRSPLLLQQAIRRSLGRDRRIFVVDGVAQAAMDSVARDGEWRSNLSQGARPLAAIATIEEASIAERAAGCLNLDFTTIDLMVGDDGPVVIEANPYGDVLDVAMMSGLDLIASVADLVELRAGIRPPERVTSRPLTKAAHRDLTNFCLARLQAKMSELGPPLTALRT